MQNEQLTKAVEQFILQRINDCGSCENQAVQEAYKKFISCAQKLNEHLTPSQHALYIDCENAYAVVDGETMHCYYRAGFSDAVLFLLGWRDGQWN